MISAQEKAETDLSMRRDMPAHNGSDVLAREIGLVRVYRAWDESQAAG